MSDSSLSSYQQMLRSLGFSTIPADVRQGLSQIPAAQQLLRLFEDDEFRSLQRQLSGVIDSMTKNELEAPEIIDSQRAERIAQGSGTTRELVFELLRQHKDWKALDAIPRGMHKTLATVRGLD